MTTHLVIPDSHATPDADNRRFDWLGNLILDLRPDVIVHLGDFASMDSLCSYDRGKKDFEGRRFKRDVEAAHDANRRIMEPLREYNQRRRELKERQYRPTMYLLGGNHDEGRINRVIQDSPELEGIVALEALGYEEWGWEYVPFQEVLEVDGVSYCHYMPSGVMGRPIGGINHARSLLMKCHKSVTVGHGHMWNEATDVTADGRRMWGLSAGCYMDHIPKYAGNVARFWWEGVALKHGVKDGDYDLERISIREVERRYS